jgi:DNA repair protein RadA/Sms
MAKTKIASTCADCGHTESRWMGRCPRCGEWGSMSEEQQVAPPRASGRAVAVGGRRAQPIADVSMDAEARLPTAIDELDRVLGGGFVPGSVTLLGGEPGAGKSTLLLQAAQAIAEAGHGVLYVSAEESPGQVRRRAERLDALHEGVLLASETDVPSILGLVEHHRPRLLIVDSVQTVRDPDTGGAAGGVAQVRECAGVLTRMAKEQGVATVLVGHVTKDGQLAGPRVLEHLVDTVTEIEGDRHHALRLLRATKNRFGAVGEVGCFEMVDAGLVPVTDAGRLFVGDAAADVPGVAVTMAVEGRRPLACEVQALVDRTTLSFPRRVASGLDTGRLNLLLAVLQRRAELSLDSHDVYASSVGGLRIVEPAVDLALCLAVASSRLDRSVSRRLVVIGEVGLAGELRLVAQTERRLSEASRLGFERALLPAAYDGPAFGLRLQRARDLSQALQLGLAG